MRRANFEPFVGALTAAQFTWNDGKNEQKVRRFLFYPAMPSSR
jgi:hypothetical protein